MIKLIGDPIEIVIEAVKRVYGEIDCDIYFSDKLWHKDDEDCLNGLAVFAKDEDNKLNPSLTKIFLSMHAPISEIPEILAHEIAHVIVGPDVVPHGTEWAAAFKKINEAYLVVFPEKYPDMVEAESILEGTGNDNESYDENEAKRAWLEDVMGIIAQEGVSAKDYSEFLNNLKSEAQND